MGNVDEMSRYVQQKKAEQDEVGSDCSESSGFESLMNDSQCEEFFDSDDEDAEMKDVSTNKADVDGFEEVVKVNRRRR